MNNYNIYDQNTLLLAKVPDVLDRANMLSTEDLGVYVSNISSFFTTRVKAISEFFSSTSDRVGDLDVKDLNEHTKKLMKLHTTAVKLSTSTKFDTVMDIQVPVMIGLSKDLVTTVDKISLLSDKLTKDTIAVLTELDMVSSKMLSDSNFRLATKPHKYKSDDGTLGYELEQVLGELIDPKSLTDRKPMHELLPNMSSLPKLVQATGKLGVITTSKNITTIQDHTRVISERINTLYNEFEGNPDIKVSKEAIRDFAYKMESTSKLVTTVVSYYHVINQVTDTLIHVINTISKFKK